MRVGPSRSTIRYRHAAAYARLIDLRAGTERLTFAPAVSADGRRAAAVVWKPGRCGNRLRRNPAHPDLARNAIDGPEVSARGVEAWLRLRTGIPLPLVVSSLL